MSSLYQYFTIDGKDYCFSSNNLEIVQLSPGVKGDDVSWQPPSQMGTKNFLEQISADTIGINLVSGCNLACEYCYLSAYSKKIQKLDGVQLEKILLFISKSRHLPKVIYFIGGGEPTLNFDLLKEIPLLCKKYGLREITFSLTTNGTTLDEEMINFFKVNQFDLSISLDGDGKTTDSFRKYKDGHGVFNDVFKNIELLQSSNMPFSCKALLQPKNDILDTFVFFENNKIDFAIDFATDSFDGHYRTNCKDISLLRRKLASVVDYYVNREQPSRIHCSSIRAGLSRIHHRMRSRTACQSVINGYNIDIDGRIYTCAMGVGNQKLTIGNIVDGIDYKEAINKKCYPESVEVRDTCRLCWIKYLCSGGCFALNTIKSGDPNLPDSYHCEIEKVFWEFIITLYIRMHPDIHALK